MIQARPVYTWFYDHVYSHGYDLAMRWFLLPFGGERAFRRHMLSSVDLGPHDRILDLCCGTGSSAAAIRDRAGPSSRVVGVDLSRGQLRRARRKRSTEGIHFVEANAAHTPFPAGLFDTVVIPHALHEMPRRLRAAVLQEARRVAGPQGQVVVLELDNPPSPARRLLLGAWLGYWLPYPLNFENPTRRDLLRRGPAREMLEAGFARARKLSKFQGAMQVVIGRGSSDLRAPDGDADRRAGRG